MSGSRELAATCARVQGRLERLLDDGLDPVDAARDEGHLEVCGACAAEREAWLTLLGTARRAEAAAALEGLSGALSGLSGRLERLPLPSAGAIAGARRAPEEPVPAPGGPRPLARVSRTLLPLAAAAAALLGLLALEASGHGLSGPSSGIAEALLPEVRVSLPSLEAMLDADGLGGGVDR